LTTKSLKVNLDRTTSTKFSRKTQSGLNLIKNASYWKVEFKFKGKSLLNHSATNKQLKT